MCSRIPPSICVHLEGPTAAVTAHRAAQSAQSYQGARAPKTIPCVCPSVYPIPPLALTGIIAPPQQSQHRQTLSSRCLGEGTYIKALIKRSTLLSLCSGSINWKGAKQLPSPRTKKSIELITQKTYKLSLKEIIKPHPNRHKQQSTHPVGGRALTPRQWWAALL